jgi:hypothetical protein
MDYTIYTSNGAFFGTVTCSQESLAPMIPDGGYSVEGKQSILSTCVGGTLSTPSETEINNYNNEIAFADLRTRRNILLSESDWTQSPDSPLTDSKKTEWATYRQNLRDLPGTVSDPSNVSFPTKPD